MTSYIKQKLFCLLFILYSKVDLCFFVWWMLHFSSDRRHTAFNSSILYRFDRRFRISLTPFSFRSLKSASIKNMLFWLAIFSQKSKIIKNLTFINAYCTYFSEKLRPMFHRIKIFYSLVSLVATDLCFLQSPLRNFNYRSYRFLVLMAEVVTHHVVLMSQHCIEYQTRAWSEEVGQAAPVKVSEESKSVSLFLRSTWILRKTQLYRMSSSSVLRAICSFLGLVVAIWSISWWI